MSANKDIIEHQAIVRKVSDGYAQVEILVRSACAGCHAKTLCSASDESRRMIDVMLAEGEEVEVGQTVSVYGRKSWGIKAVILAYVVPIVLILIMLVACKSLSLADDIAGLASLGVLFPYFFMLYLLRNKMGRSIVFGITKKY